MNDVEIETQKLVTCRQLADELGLTVARVGGLRLQGVVFNA